MRLKKEKVLRPVHPNAGLAAAYRKKLENLIEELHNSVMYWIKAAYRANEPEIIDLAQDAVPAQMLRNALRRLTTRWRKRINEAALKLAQYFAQSVGTRSDRCLQKILKDGGFSIKFKMTPAMRDVTHAAVHENVNLIKSIPQRYLTSVETMVMTSVLTGRDLGQLSKDLQTQLGVTKKRAALISRDQNSKVTAAFTRVRQLELNIKEAIWLHSHAGKKPRPTHVAMHGRKFSVAEGMWDSHEQEWIQPGQLIMCRCVSRSVVPGFS